MGARTHAAPHLRRLERRRLPRLAVALALAASGLALLAPSPATAAPAKQKDARDLPALPASAPARLSPAPVTGDFSNPPTDPGDPSRPGKSAFDPAKSKLVDSETTPTKLTYANPADGTRTDVVTQQPTRYKDAKGAWVDIDLALAPAGAYLTAKSADKAARVAAKADGASVVDVEGGTIKIRHPEASPAPATLANGAATYAKALGRRDLRVQLVDGGLEEFVVVPDAAAGSSYLTEATLSPGITARDSDAGVQFVDAVGKVVATMSNAWAADARRPLPALAPVTVRLVAAAGPSDAAAAGKETTVRIEAGVDPAWLADPARVFPLTIDPSVTAPVSTSTKDAMVVNGAYVNTNYGTYPEVWVAVDGAGLARSYLYFDMPAATTGKWISEAHVTLTAVASNCSAASPPALAVGAARATWGEGTLTWSNQANLAAPIDPDTGTTTPAPSCPTAGAVNLDATWLAWKWAHSVEANYGFVVTDAAESSGAPARSRQFASNNALSGKPTLSVTYGYGAPAPEAPAVSPADGAVISTTTPTLTVNKVADPNGDAVRYWFRGTPGPDAETGARVVNSGWITPGDPAFPGCPLGAAGTPCSYTVPAGVLHDGVSYGWHVWSNDPDGETMATWVRTLTVDLHLGADGLPTDSYGPAQVNLASGDLVVAASTAAFPAVGGPVGLSLAYNSAAPPSPGLVGSYYTWAGGTPPAPTVAPNMARVDPTVDFEWAGTPPSPAVPATGYFVRWEGAVTVPAAGDYRFGASAKDGVRIWINGALVVDRWENQFSWITPAYSAPIAFSATPPESLTKTIKIEYYRVAGPPPEPYGDQSLMHLVVLSPGQTSNLLEPVVPASWLSHPDGPLPAGWTLAPAGSGLASARLSDAALTVTDASGHASSHRSGGALGFHPLGEDDAVVAVDAGGLVTHHGAGGRTTSFDAWGNVATVSSPTDAGQSTALAYAWSAPGVPRRLVSITDPQSTRSATLRYQGRDTCPIPTGFSAAPADMLCQAAWWDGTTTDFLYTSGQLSRMVNPGGAVTDFGYASGRMTVVRSPLQADALAPSAIASTGATDATSRTEITYQDGKVQHVVLAAPAPGAARPGRTYNYFAGRVIDLALRDGADVDADGLGHLRTDYWEPAPAAPIMATKVGGKWVFGPLVTLTSRTMWSADATGVTPSFVADWGDRATTTTDGSGRSAYTTYDAADPTKRTTNAPQDVSWLIPGAPGVHDVTMTWDDQGGVSRGLSAVWWANPDLAGAPSNYTRQDAPDLLAGRPAFPAKWSARLTGDIEVPNGGLTMQLNLAGAARLYVDDRIVVDAWSTHSTATVVPTVAVPVPNASGAMERRRIRVDFSVDPANTPTPTLQLRSGGANVANAVLRPRYTNQTTTTTADTVTITSYDGGGGPSSAVLTAAGLPTSTSVSDRAGNLLTLESATYDAFGRVVTSAKPSAATTIRAYYTGTEGPNPANTCGAASAPQAGALKSITGPDPTTGVAGRKTELVYDAAGRVRGSQVGGGGWSCAAYDDRGRVTSQTFPLWDGQAARTVTYSYVVGSNPLVGTVADPAGTITAAVDLLGRLTAHTDVWAKSTTYAYDQAGRLITTKGPLGRVDTDYDGAGKVTVQYWSDDTSPSAAKGPIVATARYDDPANKGMLAGVAYGNATKVPASGNLPYDAMGRLTKLDWARTADSVVLASDEVVYSRVGRVVDQRIDGADAFPGTGAFGSTTSANFLYDPLGRLTTARVPGQELVYGYDTSACATAPAAGKNTNRGTVTVNGGLPTTYCYDNADRLVASTDPAAPAVTYDARGNSKTLGAQTLGWDGADRHVSTTVLNGSTVTYKRDATGRIIERTETGQAAVRYGYTGPGDSAVFTMTSPGNVTIDRHLGLVGGVLVTKTGTTQAWDYPNIHGDVLVSADAAGAKVGTTRSYDPYGQALAGIASNSEGAFDYGWLGSFERGTEHAPGLTPTIEMGARPYVPSLGRFLSVDPAEGGSANDYDYAGGDPVNGFDLNGLAPSCRSNRSLCERYRAIQDNFASAAYFGFTAHELSTLRSLVGAGELSSNGLDWGTDSCSSFGKVINGAFLGSFGNACGKHDFGYRNASGIFGRVDESDRKRVDNQLRRDLQDVCTQFGIVATGRTGACYAAAEITYRGVRRGGGPYYG